MKPAIFATPCNSLYITIGFSQAGCESKEMEMAATCLNGNFGANHSSDEVFSRWRKGLSLVKNRRRRFRVTADFSRRSEVAAMRQANLQVAKESAGVITLDDNLSTILTAKWGRSVYINVKKFVQFQLAINVVALIVNFFSVCLSDHASGNAPLTAVQLLWLNMIMDTLGALALALATQLPTDKLIKSAPVGKKWKFINKLTWRNILGQSLYQFAVIWCYLQAKGKALFNLYGSDADLNLNTLISSPFVFCQVAKPSADAIILGDNFSIFVTVVQWGRSVYINTQKFVQFLLTVVNVLPLVVNFYSSRLTGNAALTAVLPLTMGALGKKTMAKQLFPFFILVVLVFLLEIQTVDGRHLKVVSDVQVSLPPPSFPPTFSNQKEADTAPPPPSANRIIHN